MTRRATCLWPIDFGGDSGGATPVPIPNTEVKPTSADGTWDECPRESRSPPDFDKQRVFGPAALIFVTYPNLFRWVVGLIRYGFF